MLICFLRICTLQKMKKKKIKKIKVKEKMEKKSAAMKFARTLFPGRPFRLPFHIIHSDLCSLLEIRIDK